MPLALGFVFLSVTLLHSYGWGLFVGLPFCLGLGTVLLYGAAKTQSFGSCIGVAMLAATLVGMFADRSCHGGLHLPDHGGDHRLFSRLHGRADRLSESEPALEQPAKSDLMIALLLTLPARWEPRRPSAWTRR